jgi:hypothetical protein
MGVVLAVPACAALILPSSPWSHRFLTFRETPLGLRFGTVAFSRSLQHWINDGLMTIFFSSSPWSSSGRSYEASCEAFAWPRFRSPAYWAGW